MKQKIIVKYSDETFCRKNKGLLAKTTLNKREMSSVLKARKLPYFILLEDGGR